MGCFNVNTNTYIIESEDTEVNARVGIATPAAAAAPIVPAIAAGTYAAPSPHLCRTLSLWRRPALMGKRAVSKLSSCSSSHCHHTATGL